MEITIKATGITLTPDLEKVINDKVGGLSKFFDNIIRANVEVGRTTRHHQKGDVFLAEVNLEVPKKIIRAESETQDIIVSLNDVKDKLKIELIKYKELLRD